MRRKYIKAAVAWALELGVPVAVLLAWALWSGQSTSFYNPPLTDIIDTFAGNWVFERIPTDLVPSLLRLFIGYGVAIVAGVAGGLVLGLSRVLRQATAPVVEFARALPAPALIPIAITLLGIGDVMKYALIAFVCFFPVLLNTLDGVRSIDPTQWATVKAYGLTGLEKIRRVVLPAAGPQIFAGMRVSLSIGLIVMVVSEMVASTSGVGYFVLQSQQSFRIDDMWSGILMLGILGYLLNALFLVIEARVLAWHRGAAKVSR
jgi:ABC-type nitrate/sulfonate/bicarbonate transport system permease component